MSEHISLADYHRLYAEVKREKQTGNKFGAIKKEKGGQTFHSTGEADRYQQLFLMEVAGEISDLQTQVEYALVVNHMLIARYFADFVYKNQEGKLIVEDFKGLKTPEYGLKKKLMRAIYGIAIYESRKASRRMK